MSLTTTNLTSLAATSAATLLGAYALHKMFKNTLTSSPKYMVTDVVAKPGGHYSPAVRHENSLYVSGILPFYADGTFCQGSLEEQVKVVLDNLKLILEEGGSNLANLVSVRVYVTDVEHWPRMNKVYKEYFGEDCKPARAVVPVGALHHGFLIEVEAVGAII
ncbi:hypothetical protein ScalyP_jg10156 [Parmales sp. scaly parma]|nr:hypothetical protein ScalyP_jg10156 [Parmales sp. scaly parma]|tara:strand:- start:566 stop:1051 length:486 start_codon:yes stop_codon:yes gene_type:complete